MPGLHLNITLCLSPICLVPNLFGPQFVWSPICLVPELFGRICVYFACHQFDPQFGAKFASALGRLRAPQKSLTSLCPNTFGLSGGWLRSIAPNPQGWLRRRKKGEKGTGINCSGGIAVKEEKRGQATTGSAELQSNYFVPVPNSPVRQFAALAAGNRD